MIGGGDDGIFDSVTETTYASLGGRLMSSIKGVLAGVLMFAISFVVLWKNEGCAVAVARGLEEGAQAVVSVSSDRLDPEKEGALVHTSGEARTKEVLKDSTFGISKNAIRLLRSVEMYQWEERKTTKTEKNLGGGEVKRTIYDYRKAWSSTYHDSSQFKSRKGHHNPEMPHKSRNVQARKVFLGAFRLPKALVGRMTNDEELVLEEKDIPSCFRDKARISDGSLHFGKDPANPEIGDLRISFSVVLPQEVSVVARQVKDTFEPYKTAQDTEILMLSEGVQGAETMFQEAMEQNEIRTWALRLVGFILMFLGIRLFFDPLVTVADVVPFLGSLLGMGVGLFAGVIASALSLVTVSIAWIFYRPLLGLALLAVSAGLVAFFKFYSQKKAKE